MHQPAVHQLRPVQLLVIQLAVLRLLPVLPLVPLRLLLVLLLVPLRLLQLAVLQLQLTAVHQFPVDARLATSWLAGSKA